MPGLKRRVVEVLPEPTVLGLVQVRNGERPWQLALKRQTRAALGRPAADAGARGRGLRSTIVTAFDALQVAVETRGRITAVLDAAGVPYALVPGLRGGVVSVAV